MFMDRISRRSQVAEGVSSGNLRIPSLLFFLQMPSILSTSLNHYLQPARSSSAPWKSEDVVPGEQRVECSTPCQQRELLPQVSPSLVYEWRANGKINRDGWIVAVLFSRAGRQGSRFNQSRFQTPTFACTGKKRSQTQAAGISFLWDSVGLRLRQRVRSSNI